jgi:Domain of unknown function (DUF4345)
MITLATERRCLQIAVTVAGLVPVTGGLMGILAAPVLLQTPACGITCDSHVRYLSGLLLGIGLTAWSLVPQIERALAPFQILTGLVVIGGLARLSSLLLIGVPSRPMVFALAMELCVMPALWLWQRELARRSAL